MSKFAYAKNISYDFSQSPYYQEAVDIITESAKKDFISEQKEYYELLDSGEISSLEEYHEAFGGNNANFNKSFEENIDFYKAGIEKGLQAYLSEKHDLPQSCVIEMDDSNFDKNGKPEPNAVYSAIMNKGNVTNIAITNISSTREANKNEILWQKGYDNITKMLKSKDYKDFINLGNSLKKYSANNISLIYAQKSTASMVMSFNQWKEQYQRYPQKGTAISILAPSGGTKLSSSEEIDKYIEKKFTKLAKSEGKKLDDYKDKIDKETEALEKKLQKIGAVYIRSNKSPEFYCVNVFDISDTKPIDPSNDRVQEIMNIKKPLDKDMANYENVKASINEAASLAPIHFDENKFSQQETLFEALKDYSTQSFALSLDKIAGAKSYSEGIWQSTTNNRLLETEGIISAYLISKHIGIECDEQATFTLANALDKLSESNCISKRELFTRSYDNASKLANQFEKEFDKAFEKNMDLNKESPKKAPEKNTIEQDDR